MTVWEHCYYPAYVFCSSFTDLPRFCRAMRWFSFKWVSENRISSQKGFFVLSRQRFHHPSRQRSNRVVSAAVV